MRDILHRGSQYDSPEQRAASNEVVPLVEDPPEVIFLRDVNAQVNLLKGVLGTDVPLLNTMEIVTKSERTAKTQTLPIMEDVPPNAFLPIHVKISSNSAHWLLGVYNGRDWILFDSNRDQHGGPNEILTPIMTVLRTHFGGPDDRVRFFDHPFLNAGYEKDDGSEVDTCFHLMFYVAIQLKDWLQTKSRLRKRTIQTDTVKQLLKPPMVPRRVFDHPDLVKWQTETIKDAYKSVHHFLRLQGTEPTQGDDASPMPDVSTLDLEENDGVARTLLW